MDVGECDITSKGTDLLNLLQQSQGQPTTAVSASTDVLKKAIAEAQLGASEVLGGGSTDASLLNVYA
jgi:hypothetical protein